MPSAVWVCSWIRWLRQWQNSIQFIGFMKYFHSLIKLERPAILPARFDSLISRNFDVESYGNLLTLFWQKFRETNVFTKEITKYLIWRNIFSVRVNFLFFHSMQCGISLKSYTANWFHQKLKWGFPTLTHFCLMSLSCINFTDVLHTSLPATEFVDFT